MNAEQERELARIAAMPRDFLSTAWDNNIAWLIMCWRAEAAEVVRLQDEVTRTKDDSLAMQRYLKERTDKAEARVAELEKLLENLVDAAEAYSAEQESATHPKCGNVQPITVEQGKRLNECLAAALAALKEAGDDRR